MTHWPDLHDWTRRRNGEDCPFCRATLDDVLVELDSVRITLPEDAPLPGYVRLVYRRHVVELHELDDAQAAAFVRDVRRVAAAVQEVTGAIKLNYAIWGNVVPHLHLHVFPRRPGDPYDGRPIGTERIGGPVYGPGEHAAMRARLLETLRADAAHDEAVVAVRSDTWSTTMRDTKTTVHDLLSRLPDDCSLDDVLYHLYVIQQVERGVGDVAAGRLVPQDQVEEELRRKWQIGRAG